jgi:hypothetical protein
MSEAPSGSTGEASALGTSVDRERAMRLVARTGLLAGMLEGLIAEQLRTHAERAALQARVRQLEARVADQAPGPLLSAGAFSRIQRAQQARDDLRADLRRLRERYADAPDLDDPAPDAPYADSARPDELGHAAPAAGPLPVPRPQP